MARAWHHSFQDGPAAQCRCRLGLSVPVHSLRRTCHICIVRHWHSPLTPRLLAPCSGRRHSRPRRVPPVLLKPVQCGGLVCPFSKGFPQLLLTTRMVCEASHRSWRSAPHWCSSIECGVMCSCDGIFIPDITMANLYSLEQDFVITSQCASPCSAVSTDC
jgi:hypothetical protein